MILALSTGQKLGLAAIAAVFIVFALASSFLFPRSNVDFPGRRLPLFVAVTMAMVIAMLGGMVVLAREDEEEGAHAAEPAHTETAGGETGATDTGGGTETGGGATGGADGGGGGEPAAGKEVFASVGCGSCHTLADAGSSGTVGPNLDERKPDRETVVTVVTNGRGAMPAFQGQLDEQQIEDVAAYVASAAGSG